ALTTAPRRPVGLAISNRRANPFCRAVLRCLCVIRDAALPGAPAVTPRDAVAVYVTVLSTRTRASLRAMALQPTVAPLTQAGVARKSRQMSLTVAPWILSEGLAGLQAQAVGLAEASGLTPDVRGL